MVLEAAHHKSIVNERAINQLPCLRSFLLKPGLARWHIAKIHGWLICTLQQVFSCHFTWMMVRIPLLFSSRCCRNYTHENEGFFKTHPYLKNQRKGRLGGREHPWHLRVSFSFSFTGSSSCFKRSQKARKYSANRNPGQLLLNESELGKLLLNVIRSCYLLPCWKNIIHCCLFLTISHSYCTFVKRKFQISGMVWAVL